MDMDEGEVGERTGGKRRGGHERLKGTILSSKTRIFKWKRFRLGGQLLHNSLVFF